MNQLIQNICSIVVMDNKKKEEFLSTLKNIQQHNNKSVENNKEDKIIEVVETTKSPESESNKEPKQVEKITKLKEQKVRKFPSPWLTEEQEASGPFQSAAKAQFHTNKKTKNDNLTNQNE